MKHNQRRHDMAEACYPYPISFEEFLRKMRESLDGIEQNAISLRKDTSSVKEFWNSENLIEEWFEVFARWSEIQSEGFDPFITKERDDS